MISEFILPAVPQSATDNPFRVNSRIVEVAKQIESKQYSISPKIYEELLSALESYAFSTQELFEFFARDSGLFLFFLKSIHMAYPLIDELEPQLAIEALSDNNLVMLVNRASRHVDRKPQRDSSIIQTEEMKKLQLSLRAAFSLGKAIEKTQAQCLLYSFASKAFDWIISWSYPSIFLTARSRSRVKKTTITSEIENILGVRAEETIDFLFKKWRLINPLKNCVSQPNFSGFTPQEICQIIDLKVQSDPLTSQSSSSKKWLQDRSGLEELYGSELVDELDQIASQIDADYLESQQKKNLSEDLIFESIALKNNSQLKECLKCLKEDQREPLLDVVRELTLSGSPRKALNKLVKSVVPRLGFSSGCLFVPVGELAEIQPVLGFGALPLSVYDQYIIDKYQGVKPFLFNHIPFKTEHDGMVMNDATSICSGLDDDLYLGVIYLEVEKDFAYHTDLIVKFKAVRSVLVACLKSLQK